MSTPPTVPNTKLQKYLFRGHAIALSGSIRKPYFQELGNHLEISTYAGSAGHNQCSNRGFSVNGDVSYDLATTETLAEILDDGVYRCTAKVQVQNLRVAKRLQVDQVTCVLRSTYDSRTYPGRMIARVHPAGSSISNLKIDGTVQKLAMPAAFSLNSDAQDAFFRGEFDSDAGYHPGHIPPHILVEGFGTIYYGEWAWVHAGEHHRQHLTMLRLALGCDFGASIDVGTSDNNGSGWPPLS